MVKNEECFENCHWGSGLDPERKKGIENSSMQGVAMSTRCGALWENRMDAILLPLLLDQPSSELAGKPWKELVIREKHQSMKN